MAERKYTITSSTNNEQTAARAVELIRAVIARYEQENPRPDARPQDRAFLAWFRGGLLAIGEQLKDLQINNLEQLDQLFRRVYIPYTIRAGIIPSIVDFCLMTNINPDSIAKLSNTNSIANTIYNNWLSVIRQFVIGELSNSIGSNINLIFIAKSVYGLSDSPKHDNSTPRQIIKQDRQAIIAELTGENVENSENVENLANNVSDNSL